MAESKPLQGHCLCKRSTLSFSVTTTSLPLPTHICNCSICRRTHGTLFTLHARIPEPTVNFETFTTYKSSEDVTRYFCSTCGCHMLDFVRSDGQWYLAVAVIEGPESLWRIRQLFNLDSTGDGGLGFWLNNIDGVPLKKWKNSDVIEESEHGDWTQPSFTSIPSRTNSEEKLLVQCHCKGVQLHISRPTPCSREKLPESLNTKDPTKWHASHDVCTSCRLVSGVPVISWAFPTLDSVMLPDGTPYRRLSGTAKEYQSSSDVWRTFCGVCGAMLTYQCDDRPEMIDIAVGAVDAPSGARAEDWLEWRTHKVSYEEDAVLHGFIDGFKNGLLNSQQ